MRTTDLPIGHENHAQVAGAGLSRDSLQGPASTGHCRKFLDGFQKQLSLDTAMRRVPADRQEQLGLTFGASLEVQSAASISQPIYSVSHSRD